MQFGSGFVHSLAACSWSGNGLIQTLEGWQNGLTTLLLCVQDRGVCQDKARLPLTAGPTALAAAAA